MKTSSLHPGPFLKGSFSKWVPLWCGPFLPFDTVTLTRRPLGGGGPTLATSMSGHFWALLNGWTCLPGPPMGPLSLRPVLRLKRKPVGLIAGKVRLSGQFLLWVPLDERAPIWPSDSDAHSLFSFAFQAVGLCPVRLRLWTHYLTGLSFRIKWKFWIMSLSCFTITASKKNKKQKKLQLILFF